MLTDEGLKNLGIELEELKTVKRKEISEKIKLALSFGDLSENSEYDDAKDEQAITEARIATIENILKNVKIIDENELKTDRVHIGSRVTLLDVQYKDEMEFKIVGSNEADPSAGKISDESPVGKAVLGKKAGQKVVVAAPDGEIVYKVLKISK